ncbi:MAG: protein kinase [Deltaproteobacteria bacterium]|nr:protein kinase [Deltaproteobacteria bacterium]
MGSQSEIPPDTLLGGRFRLIKRIGRGGMGDVWVARNEATQAEVAIKTLVKADRNPTHDERFRREARLAATVTHRNVVRIFDLVDDQEDGTLALVMELLRGGTLEAALKQRGTLTTMQTVAVAVPILSALHHVHEKGIIHRDVKPANVFFAVEPDGHVIPKMLDFGIAKLPSASSSLTVDGSVLGTPHYMSPEQIRGADDLDGRSDMFSFAVCIYEMLTGVRIFQRDSAAASLAAVLEHEVDPDPRIEPRIWVALSRALAKRPYERQANCAELADSLRSAVDVSDEDLTMSLLELRPREELGEAMSTGSAFNVVPRKRREKKSGLPWTLAAAAGAAVVAAIATFAATRAGGDARADGGKGATSGAVVGSAEAPGPSAAGASSATPTKTGAPSPSVTSAPSDTTPIATTTSIPTPIARSGASGSTSGPTPAGTPVIHKPGKTPPPPASGKPPKPIATAPGF